MPHTYLLHVRLNPVRDAYPKIHIPVTCVVRRVAVIVHFVRHACQLSTYVYALHLGQVRRKCVTGDFFCTLGRPEQIRTEILFRYRT